MIEIIICSLIVSLVTSGFKISTGDGMLLNFIKVWLDKKLTVEKWQYYSKQVSYYDISENDRHIKIPYKIYYPILYCIKCMPSIYGTSICLLFFPFGIELLFQIPLVVFSSVTLNSIFYQWYD